MRWSGSWTIHTLPAGWPKPVRSRPRRASRSSATGQRLSRCSIGLPDSRELVHEGLRSSDVGGAGRSEDNRLNIRLGTDPLDRLTRRNGSGRKDGHGDGAEATMTQGVVVVFDAS